MDSVEKQKMLSGELYNPSDALLVADRKAARCLLRQLNSLEDQNDREAVVDNLLHSTSSPYIEPPFYCDYGYNITIGENFYCNFNCCFLDCGKISIGNNCFLGPNVQLYTVNHPLDVVTRRQGLEVTRPICIGDDVWIGGGAIILPGVSIGRGAVIGAGAVVSKDIGPFCMAVGNPARVIKTIS